MKRLKGFIIFLVSIYDIIAHFNSKQDRPIIIDYNYEPLKNLYTVILNSGINVYEATKAAIIKVIEHIIEQLDPIYSEQQVTDFKFLLAGISDELIIDSGISRDYEWPNYLIEKTLFSTSISGEKIISIINTFIRSHSLKDTEMLVIYFYTICIGYKGEYKHNPKSLHTLKETLIKLISSEIYSDNLEVDIMAEGCYLASAQEYSRFRTINYKSIYRTTIAAIIATLVCTSILVIYIYNKSFIYKIQ